MNCVQKEIHKKIFEANHIVIFDDVYELLCYNDDEGKYELKLKNASTRSCNSSSSVYFNPADSDDNYVKLTPRELDLLYHEDDIKLYKMVEL